MVFKRRDRRTFLVRAREFFYPQRGWRRAFEYLGLRLRRLPDTPHRIALGVSCGAFVSFTPLFGIHVLLAVALAWALRANVLSSLIGTLVGNPLTLPFIASLSMALGNRILGTGATGRDFKRVLDAFRQAGEGLWQAILSPFGHGAPDWSRMSAFFTDILLPYLVGGLLPGLVAAIASYYVTRPLVAAYQSARRARLAAHSRQQSKTRLEAGDPD